MSSFQNIPTRAVDYPAAETYDKFSPEEIKALCELDIYTYFPIPPLEKLSGDLYYRLKAYWTLRGATDPGIAASVHSGLMCPSGPPDPAWETECKARGWVYPKSLHDLEQKFLPPVIPDVQLIIERCPQMAMIHALRGDVSEPYWWAVLSITERGTPNLSHECSDGYSGFSEDELAERTARIHREDKKPALCSRLDEVNTNVCSLCKFKGVVRSPIALGYEHEPKKKAGLV